MSLAASVRRWAANPAALPLLAALAVSLPFLLRVSADPDLWWHVRTGELILERAGLPDADPFSFTAAGAPWINHEWGTDVLLAAVYRLGGDRALVLLRMLLFVTTMALLARLIHDRFPHPLGLVALLLGAVDMVSFFLNLRPHTFTYLLVLALLAAADAHRRGSRRALWAWPPLMVLWVNLHGGFVLGLAVAAFAASALLLRRNAGAEPERGRVLLAGGLTALAPLLNPYGPRLFGYLAQELGGDHSMVLEWLPIARVPGLAGTFLAFTLLPLAALLVAPRAQRFEQVALWLLATVATWRHGRFLVLLALAGTLVLASALGELWPRLTAGGRRRLVAALGRPAWAAALCLAIAAVGAVRIARDLAEHRLRLPIDTTHYPVLAVEFLKAHDLGPNLALRLDWGGFAIWHLWPDYRVSADGRNLTVYDAGEIDAQLRAYDQGTWGERFAGRADVALIENGGPALEGILAGDDWVPVYRDPLAAVLVPPEVAAELPERQRPRDRPERREDWNYFP